MAILLNDNLSVNAPSPTDSRYGPYATTALALSGVILANRYIGLTVGVITGGVVSEYWFNDGTADGDLVAKSAGGGSDKNYRHVQGSAAATWNIAHGLGKRPSIMVVDSGGSTVEGEYSYVDDNNVTLTFTGAFSGEAYLN